MHSMHNVCILIYIYVMYHMHVCMYVCIVYYMWPHIHIICIYVCMNVCVHTYMYVRLIVHVCTFKVSCIYDTCVHGTHTYIYTVHTSCTADLGIKSIFSYTVQNNSTTRARTLTPKHSFGIFSVQVKWIIFYMK